MGGGSYISIVRIALFFLAVFIGSRFSQKVGVSTIVAEILVGVALGPSVGGLMPKEYAECDYNRLMNCDLLKNGGWHTLKGHDDLQDLVREHEDDCQKADMLEKHGSQEKCLIAECDKAKLHHCSVSPDIFTLLGHIGVSMMIFEAGMHVDFAKVKMVGAKACYVAVIGTFLPIILGTVLIGAMGYDFYPDGLAVGISLSPTSIGISLKLLNELGVLDRFFGQAIIVAAVVDDVLALLAYSLFFAIAASSGGLEKSVALLSGGIILMFVGIYLAVRHWPRWMEKILETQPAHRKVEFHSSAMWMVFLAYASAFHFLGSHLWGCFVGGLSFTAVPHSHHIWVAQTKPFTTWMLRVFFSCSVSFAIPIKKLLTVESFLKGAVIGLVPCLGAKVFCAPFMGGARWVIGWGMCGRAEFAYLIAQMALSTMLMSEEVFSICIWSLLWATLIAPFAFRFVLNRYTSNQEKPLPALCGVDTGSSTVLQVIPKSDTGTVAVELSDEEVQDAPSVIKEAWVT